MIQPRAVALLSLLLCCRLAASTESSAPATEQVAKASEHAPAEHSESVDHADDAAHAEHTESAAVQTPAASAEGEILQPNTTVEAEQVAHGANEEEIASLLRIGRAKFEKNDFASAQMAFMQVLVEKASPEQDHEALLALARSYRKNGDFTKATAVYERFLKDYPSDPELPMVYLELGRTVRALGAYKRAIARFYSVLNSTLKLPEDGQDTYRQLARTAQFEIAETYFQIGDYAQATRFFSRLKLLDLAPEDRARAFFKSVFSLALANENDKAISGLVSFIEQYPDDENIPEAKYLLSTCYRKQGRSQESLRTTLDLLRAEAHITNKDPKRWAYWQRKTGNQLANEFYQSGDFASAMAIYQNLAQLSTDPTWTLPVQYQTGLCYERLRRFDKARECYQSIIDGVKTATKSDAAPKGELTDLADMATWRLGQLEWQFKTDATLSTIFPPPQLHQPDGKPESATPSSKDHDTHGNPAVASNTLR
ncbi:MAG TPA: tetratricopeptide repeat protein [Opitutaceae bacterium]|nr:tetratricopeptide repeat protein [Opitutaceae bacterium]